MSDPSIPAKMYCITNPLTKTEADTLHDWCIANIAAYAQSVTDGQTLRWCFPTQDSVPGASPFDPPIFSGPWFAIAKDRCLPGLTADQTNSLINWQEYAILTESMTGVCIEGTLPSDRVVILVE